MTFRTSDGYILQRIARRTYPRVRWADGDLTFQDNLGFPVDDAGEKVDGEFLPETPGEAARRRIDSVLNTLDDWDDWTMEMGGDEHEDGREDLARIRRMRCHRRRALNLSLLVSRLYRSNENSVLFKSADKNGSNELVSGRIRLM